MHLSVTTTRETELKFDCDPEATLPPLDLPATDEHEVVLRAVYWETGDKRLMRWGASLRHRTASDHSEDGWTLKLGVPSVDVVDGVTRDEVTADGASNEPPAHLVDAVRALTLGQALQPQATITTRRHIRRLGTDMESPVVEVADDLVRSSLLGTDGPTFRQVEVELLDPDGIETLRAVGKRLSAQGLSPSSHGSKVEQVLGGPLDGPFDVARLTKRSTVADLVPLVIGGGAKRLVSADPMVRTTDDPEAVHEARKAIRDLRSQLKMLRPLLDRERIRAVRAELKWIGQLLGDLRDVHVLGAMFEDQLSSLDVSDDGGADDIRRRLADQAAFRRNLVASALSGDRYVSLLIALEELVADPPFRDDVALDTSARAFMRRSGRKSWKRSTRARRHLGSPAEATELHELRKDVKQSRATAKAAQLARLDSKRFTARAGDLKDELGDHHDTIVWMDWLRQHHDRFGADGAFLAGRLHEDADGRRRELERTWPAAWKAVSTGKSTGWMH